MTSSWGGVIPVQVLDRFYTGGSAQITSQAQQTPTTYGVWGSFFPSAWQAGNPNAVISLYVLPAQDPNRISGHDLAWWKANHPDWILHPCDTTGTIHPEYTAYMPGSGFPDVALDISNPEVVNYLTRQTIYPYMIANGYNALALDNILFTNVLTGPNPTLGEGNPISGWYACGTVDASNTPHIRYSSPTDPNYARDMLNLVHTIKTDFKVDPTITGYNFHLLANHTFTSLSDPNMQEFLRPSDGIDVLLDENGFGNYGNGTNSNGQSVRATYYSAIQRQGTEVWITNYSCSKRATSSGPQCPPPTAQQVGYNLALYEISNQGNLGIYIGPGSDVYSYQNAYAMATNVGPACADYTKLPNRVLVRKFQNAIAVANGSDNGMQTYTLPAGHSFSSADGRSVPSGGGSLTLNPTDGYLLLTSNGCN